MGMSVEAAGEGLLGQALTHSKDVDCGSGQTAPVRSPRGSNGDPGAQLDEAQEPAAHDKVGSGRGHPFFADMELSFGCGQQVSVCSHLGPVCPPGGVQCIAIFLPGVSGGVGPCRMPGTSFDDDALYPTVARGLESSGHPVDSYRCSWAHANPSMEYTVEGTCYVLHHALKRVAKRCRSVGSQPPSEIKVVFVGHSLGGGVAIHVAGVAAKHFGPGSRIRGLRDTAISVAGVCCLNGGGAAAFGDALAKVRCLFVCGQSDRVVSPLAVNTAYKAFPSPHKSFLALPLGTHDLHEYKDDLLVLVADFILRACNLVTIA